MGGVDFSDPLLTFSRLVARGAGAGYAEYGPKSGCASSKVSVAVTLKIFILSSLRYSQSYFKIFF